jgi:hypothetical protein
MRRTWRYALSMRNLFTAMLGSSVLLACGGNEDSTAGVRDATNTKLMTATIANGDCNSSGCHGGTQGWVHLP